ncbi:MAG TPA: prepilin-type N-terminal cleavage/methylation domain-containing protein [Sedimentisphaerales bacterium]|nr:prepilin-type N-terminal cleavage/methylation domain-containing protein [Sedimentisphaerales bacterium]
MIPTFTAQIRVDAYMLKCVHAKMRDYTGVSTHTRVHTSAHSRARAFTLTELVVVILILSLFVLLTMMNLFGFLRKNTFKIQAQQFVSTMQMAASAAAESERRYEVIIDLTEQSYTLRQITSPDLSQVLEEEIIVTNDFGANCQVYYVLFDDLMETDEDHQVAKFRAGHAGWQYGGKIVLLDEREQPYSVVVSRMNRVVTLKRGDVEFMLPKAKDEVLF